MYADDIALIADTSVKLQRKLRALESFCQKWGMEVNLAKTKIIVFRNGGKLSSREKFLYNGKTLNIVTHYKYLGIVFNSRLTWGYAIKELAGKANKAVSMIRCAMWKLGVFEHKVLFKIFDSLVVPILCYGSEVWGYEYRRKIEQVHINLPEVSQRNGERFISRIILLFGWICRLDLSKCTLIARCDGCHA